MVKTNWRWGTWWQTELAIHSPMVRVRRWWQVGQRWREAFVAAVGVRADEAGESGAEVAALVEAVDGCDGGGAQRSVGGAVAG